MLAYEHPHDSDEKKLPCARLPLCAFFWSMLALVDMLWFTISLLSSFHGVDSIEACCWQSILSQPKPTDHSWARDHSLTSCRFCQSGRVCVFTLGLDIWRTTANGPTINISTDGIPASLAWSRSRILPNFIRVYQNTHAARSLQHLFSLS